MSHVPSIHLSCAQADKKALADKLAADDAALSLALGVSITDEPSASDTLLDEYQIQMERTPASLDSGSTALSLQLMKQMMAEKRKDIRRQQQAALKAKQRAALEDANRRAAELKAQADAVAVIIACVRHMQ